MKARHLTLAMLGGGLIHLASLLFPGAGAAGLIAGTLTVRDALTSPGHPARIETRLIHRGLLGGTGLGGELIELRIDGKKVGTAMTGGDGRAFFEYTPKMRGNHLATVRLTGSKRVESAEAVATVASWERRRPILLVEIEALAEEPARAPVLPRSLPLELAHADKPAPAPDAAVELKRLTDFFYNVVYVSRTDRDRLDEEGDDRVWLKQHRFPIGLLVTLKPGKSALTDMIGRMRAEGWDNLKAGVGRTNEFAEVLVEQRMTAVVVPEPDRGELPQRARAARDWKDVRRKLQA